MQATTEKREIYENYLQACAQLDHLLKGDGPVGFDHLLHLSESRAHAVDRLESLLSQFYEDSDNTLSSHTASGNLWIMSQSLRAPNVVQITYFSGDSTPMGDMQFLSVQSAMQEMLRATKIEDLRNYNNQTFEQYLDQAPEHEDQPMYGEGLLP